MASNEDIRVLMEEAGVSGSKLQQALVGTANDIMRRVDLNLQRLEVGDYNPHPHSPGSQHRIPGTMRRSIYWKVFSSTGGDEMKIKFWMENVAQYVELSVQGNNIGGKGHVGWKVRDGGLPQSITSKNYRGIRIDRTNKNAQVLKRKAKPFIGGEVRLHGRMLFDRLIRHYSWVGNVVMAAALDVRTIKPYRNGGKLYAHTGIYRDKLNPRGFRVEQGDFSWEDVFAQMKKNRNTDIAALRFSGWNPVAGNFEE